MNDIVVYQAKNGGWTAKRKGGGAIRGRGDSSVEAHCDLLEREASAKAEEAKS